MSSSYRSNKAQTYGQGQGHSHGTNHVQGNRQRDNRSPTNTNINRAMTTEEQNHQTQQTLQTENSGNNTILVQDSYVEVYDFSSRNIQNINDIEELYNQPETKQRITFSQNNITEIPFEFIKLTNLSYLDLSHNFLMSIEGLRNCSELVCLNVSYNRISLTCAIVSLRKLQSLDLSFNQVSVDETFIKNLRMNKEILSLKLEGNTGYDFNQIKHWCLGTLGKILYLDAIKISNSQKSGVKKQIFVNLHTKEGDIRCKKLSEYIRIRKTSLEGRGQNTNNNTETQQETRIETKEEVGLHAINKGISVLEKLRKENEEMKKRQEMNLNKYRCKIASAAKMREKSCSPNARAKPKMLFKGKAAIYNFMYLDFNVGKTECKEERKEVQDKEAQQQIQLNAEINASQSGTDSEIAIGHARHASQVSKETSIDDRTINYESEVGQVDEPNDTSILTRERKELKIEEEVRVDEEKGNKKTEVLANEPNNNDSNHRVPEEAKQQNDNENVEAQKHTLINENKEVLDNFSEPVTVPEEKDHKPSRSKPSQKIKSINLFTKDDDDMTIGKQSKLNDDKNESKEKLSSRSHHPIVVKNNLNEEDKEGHDNQESSRSQIQVNISTLTSNQERSSGQKPSVVIKKQKPNAGLFSSN